MSWIEVEAKTRDEAEAKLLQELGETDINNIEVEELKVVRRFLGMGGRTVKLRGKLKEVLTTEDQNANEPEGEEAEEEKPEPHSSGEEETAVVDAPSASEEPVPVKTMLTGASLYKPWASEGKSGIVIPPEGRGFGKVLYSATPLADEREEVENMDEPDSGDGSGEESEFIPPQYQDDADSQIPEEIRTKAVEFVNNILNEMSISGDVKGYKLEDRLLVHIDSEDGGLLIGRKSETLDSLQYLTDIIVNRGNENRTRIVLDVEHYKERRRHKIYTIALEAAENAVQKDRPMRLLPMSPAERQIIHATLADNESVETISEGQGSRRRVVIHPASEGRKPRRGGGRGRGR